MSYPTIFYAQNNLLFLSTLANVGPGCCTVERKISAPLGYAALLRLMAFTEKPVEYMTVF